MIVSTSDDVHTSDEYKDRMYTLKLYEYVTSIYKKGMHIYIP